MGDSTGPALRHVARFGTTAQPGDTLPGPVAPGMTLNSPVGVALDRAGNVWVCDTGNNRLLVFDASLSTLRHVLHAPESAAGGEAARAFRMPFHVCPHPEKNRVFVSDMGNSRIVVLDLADGAPRFAGALGNTAQKGFAPLQDPNGLTLVRGTKGFELCVNDEFFHNAADPLRNRCVRFTEDGLYLGEFRSVQVKGRRHDLLWPQGLASDAEGNLYLANTGSYEILRCPADAKVDDDYVARGGSPLIAHRFGTPGAWACSTSCAT
ncbi:MAG: NHL repeat-containing protein [Betaproteobacteria bacterium]|nr:NHL repeat-containing protein [Betaproteobacteria bacterium]